MVRVCKSNIIFLCIRTCIRRLSICLSSYLLNHCAEFNQLISLLRLMVRVCESNIIFRASILLCIPRPSICLSCYLLLNHWAKFNQTCYITSSHGKGVRKQHYFSVCLSVHHPPICPSCYLLLNPWVEFNQTCYITYPHGKGVHEQHYFSMHTSSVHLSVMLSPPKPLVRI